MKKCVSMLLIVMLILSMGMVAFGEEPTPRVVDQPGFKVIYELAKNSLKGIIAPAQTFTYTIEPVRFEKDNKVVGGVEIPEISTQSVTFDEADLTTATNPVTKTVSLDEITTIKWPQVGVYYYNVVQSVTNKAAGVTYSSEPQTLKVSVFRDENNTPVAGHVALNKGDKKTDGFNNTYTAGNLTVKKQVTGNMGDTEKPFEVDVTFTTKTGEAPVKSVISYQEGAETKKIQPGDWKSTDDTTVEKVVTKRISLKDKDEITFQNIPVGVSYTVKEEDYKSDGYDTSYKVNDEASAPTEEAFGLMDADGETVTIENKKDGPLETSLMLDRLPYLLLLTLSGAGLLWFFAKKRGEFEA